MADHPNATMVRRMLEAMMAGDRQAAAAGIADDIVWHEIGNPEPIRGKATLAARMANVPEEWGELSGSIHDIVADDEHAIALLETTAIRGGRSLTYRTAEIYHVRDGMVTERWAFSDDTAAIAEFFA